MIARRIQARMSVLPRARIQTRLAALAAQLDRGRLVYADLEVRRDATIAQIAELQRQLDAMAGGMQELERLLAAEDAPS